MPVPHALVYSSRLSMLFSLRYRPASWNAPTCGLPLRLM